MVKFHHHHGVCGQRAAEREFVKLRAQPTAKAKAMYQAGRRGGDASTMLDLDAEGSVHHQVLWAN